MFRKFVLWSQTNKDKSTEIFPPSSLNHIFFPSGRLYGHHTDKQVKERTTFLCCIALALKAIAARKRTVQKHYICIILCNALSFRSENLEQRKSIFVSRKCDILMTTFVCLFTLQCKKAGRSFCFTASTWPIEPKWRRHFYKFFSFAAEKRFYEDDFYMLLCCLLDQNGAFLASWAESSVTRWRLRIQRWTAAGISNSRSIYKEIGSKFRRITESLYIEVV